MNAQLNKSGREYNGNLTFQLKMLTLFSKVLSPCFRFKILQVV